VGILLHNEIEPSAPPIAGWLCVGLNVSC